MKRKVSLLLVIMFLLQMLVANSVVFADPPGRVWVRLSSQFGGSGLVNTSFENLHLSEKDWICTILGYDNHNYYLIEEKEVNETSGNVFLHVPLEPGVYWFGHYGYSAAAGKKWLKAISDNALCVYSMPTVVYSNMPEIITAGEFMDVSVSGAYTSPDTWVGVFPWYPDNKYCPNLFDLNTHLQSMGSKGSASVRAPAPEQPGLYCLKVFSLLGNGSMSYDSIAVSTSNPFGVAPKNATQEDLESTQSLLSNANLNDLVPDLPQIDTDLKPVSFGETDTISLQAEADNSSVKLSWTSAANTQGLTGYNIYRTSSSGDYSSTPITDFPINALHYTDSKVTNGLTYYYIVKPVYGTTIGDASNEAMANPKATGVSGGETIVLTIGNPIMTIDGVQQEIDPGYGTAPVIVNDRTFVPIRAIIEGLGGSVGWDGSQQMVTINQNNTVINIWINSTGALVNGVNTVSDVAPFVSSTNRTMVPLRFIIENLGLEAIWDGSTKTITINKGRNTVPPPQINDTTVPPVDLTQPDATTPSQGQNAQVDFSGKWYTEFNIMRLTQSGNEVSGIYEMYTGSINGTVSGNKLTASWYEEETANSGTLEFDMGPNRQSFSGTYQQQGDNQCFDWHGVLLPVIQEDGSWTGLWDTDNGYMILRQNGKHVSGVYDLQGNTSIEGTVSGHKLVGIWREGKNSGTFEFTMESDGDCFEGFFGNYNDVEDAEPLGWGGYRIDY